MKLVEILARELVDWPDAASYSYSSGSLARFADKGKTIDGYIVISEKPEDHATAHVTRAEWQAAVDALKIKEDHDRLVESFAPPFCGKEWNGEGLPPVGTECMVTPHNTLWGFDNLDTRRVKVVARKSDHEWLMELLSDGAESLSFITTRTDKVDFAPFVTPEQIAAEEREKAIQAMRSAWEGGKELCKFAALYDAGFRKQGQK